MRKALSILFLVFGVVYGVHAQNDYPIYVTPTLIPPYSLKLSDYSKFGSQQLMVNIVVNDLNIANLPVKLRIKLETVGITIENPPTINTTPIFLDGGAAIVLSGDDLKDYFDINNLIFKGYGKEAYKRSGQLPEGFYKVTIEVLHFQTNRLISNQGSATAWIALGKPPVLKLPENNKEMGEFKGMPLVFSWLPSNVGSPVSANSVQYTFEMWEIRVNGISPYVVASSVPVFHEETTQNTNISIYPSSLLMEPGMKYAWRVTASDLSGLVPFEQDGHSEIRVITYKSKCDSVTALTATNQGKDGIFKWESKDNHTSFNVEMRNPVTSWTMNSQTYDSKSEFFDLEYGATYELRVQAVCNGDPESVSDFSQWKTLVIPKKRTTADTSSCPNCKCDDNLGAGTLENIELKKDLKPGDTIVNRYGTSRFIVKSVESQGDGVYKGQFLFWAELWKLKFLCNYWDLSVNTNKEIVNMDYESVYNPQYLLDVDATTKYLDKLAGEINELTINATIKDTIAINETITSIYVNAGDSLIAVTVGPDGTLHEVVIQPDTKDIEKTMVKGANGEEYVVNRDGEIMGVKEYQNTGGGNNRKMDEYTQKKESEQLSATPSVQFSASTNQKYGFDAFSSEKQTLATEYPDLKNGYKPTYKSIASYSPDKVVASSAGNGITFRDEMGIPAIVSGTELTVRGGTDGSITSLYAYKAVNDTTEEIAGKLNIMSYDEQTKKVYIIPVNDAHMPDALELQKVLNTVYAQAVTKWEVVKIDKNIGVTFENGNMTHGGSSAISVYNADQKSIISKFKETDDFEKGALYLFFVDNVQSKTDDIAGFMPLQRQAGFIYDNPSTFIVAHELSHGAFNLRHTFSPEKLIAPKGTTKNLMDYNSGTELWKHQWNYIHDPQNILFAWAQSEEEGEAPSALTSFVCPARLKSKYQNESIHTSKFFDAASKEIKKLNSEANLESPYLFSYLNIERTLEIYATYDFLNKLLNNTSTDVTSPDQIIVDQTNNLKFNFNNLDFEALQSLTFTKVTDEAKLKEKATKYGITIPSSSKKPQVYYSCSLNITTSDYYSYFNIKINDQDLIKMNILSKNKIRTLVNNIKIKSDRYLRVTMEVLNLSDIAEDQDHDQSKIYIKLFDSDKNLIYNSDITLSALKPSKFSFGEGSNLKRYKLDIPSDKVNALDYKPMYVLTGFASDVALTCDNTYCNYAEYQIENEEWFDNQYKDIIGDCDYLSYSSFIPQYNTFLQNIDKYDADGSPLQFLKANIGRYSFLGQSNLQCNKYFYFYVLKPVEDKLKNKANLITKYKGKLGSYCMRGTNDPSPGAAGVLSPHGLGIAVDIYPKGNPQLTGGALSAAYIKLVTGFDAGEEKCQNDAYGNKLWRNGIKYIRDSHQKFVNLVINDAEVKRTNLIAEKYIDAKYNSGKKPNYSWTDASDKNVNLKPNLVLKARFVFISDYNELNDNLIIDRTSLKESLQKYIDMVKPNIIIDQNYKTAAIDNTKVVTKEIISTNAPIVLSEEEKSNIAQLGRFKDAIDMYRYTIVFKDQSLVVLKDFSQLVQNLSYCIEHRTKENYILPVLYDALFDEIEEFNNNIKGYKNYKSYGESLVSSINGIGFYNVLMEQGFFELDDDLITTFMDYDQTFKTGHKFSTNKSITISGALFSHKLDGMHIQYNNYDTNQGLLKLLYTLPDPDPSLNPEVEVTEDNESVDNKEVQEAPLDGVEQ